MSPNHSLERIHEAGLVVVIRAPTPDEAVSIVGALIQGGATAIELTFTTPGVDDALRRVRAMYGDEPLVGAGTIRSSEQVARAVAAGADFLVSPNLRADVLEAMLATGRPAIPGVFTPSEVAEALDLGAEVVKLFPGSIGGPGHLKALRGPFPGLRVVPTGGVDLETLSEWFKAGAFAVGVGGEICPPKMVEEENWTEIAARARRFVDATSAARREEVAVQS